MPIRRYFAFVGSVLLMLLFVLDWYLPHPAAEADRADVDRSIIRIHSRHKWPSAVDFDTRQPTIIPPQPVVIAAEPAIAIPPREAFAMVHPPSQPVVSKPARTVKHVRPRTRLARAPTPRLARYDVSGFS